MIIGQIVLTIILLGIFWHMPLITLKFYQHYRADPYLKYAKPYQKMGIKKWRRKYARYWICIERGRWLIWVYLLFLWGIWWLEPSFEDLLWWQILVFFLLLLSWFDLKFAVLPDAIVLSLAICGALACSRLDLSQFERRSLELLTLIVSCLFIRYVWSASRASMGLGDIKLIWAFVYWLGLMQTVYAVFYACVVALICCLLMKGYQPHQDIKRICFGPFLSIGAILVYLKPLEYGYGIA